MAMASGRFAKLRCVIRRKVVMKLISGLGPVVQQVNNPLLSVPSRMWMGNLASVN